MIRIQVYFHHQYNSFLLDSYFRQIQIQKEQHLEFLSLKLNHLKFLKDIKPNLLKHVHEQQIE